MSKKMVLSVMAAVLFSTGAFAARSTEDFRGELQADQLKRGQAMDSSSTSSSEELLSAPFEGTNSGGGSSKPPVSVGNGNIRAITQSEKVLDIIGFNFSIEEIKLVGVNSGNYKYSVVARTINGEVDCKFNVVVQNLPTMMDAQVKVVAAKRISGCKLD